LKKTVYFYFDPAYINNIRNGKEQQMTKRTSAYQFTTSTVSAAEIAELKKTIKIINARARVVELMTGEKQVRHRVAIRGRLGKHNVYAPLYRRGGEHYRASSQTIKREHASRFDVYMHSYYAD
jgi:hypothetical protein